MGKEEIIVHIISTYRVPQRSSNVDKITAYPQQNIMLTDLNHTKPQPREQFVIDLSNHFRTSEHNAMILLALDANKEILPDDALTKKTSIATLMREFNLTNVFQHHYEHTGDTSRKQFQENRSYSGFGERLASDQTPLKKMMESDHRTRYVEFDELILFGNTDRNPPWTIQRKLRSA